MPTKGLEWFKTRKPPRHSYLTNRHYYRQSDRFASAFGIQVWRHQVRRFLEGSA